MIATPTAATKDEDNAAATTADARKGIHVLLEFSEPWHHIDCLVTANKYFGSMEAAKAMQETGFTFIGNVNQFSRWFSIWNSSGIQPSHGKLMRRLASTSSSPSVGLIGGDEIFLR